MPESLKETNGIKIKSPEQHLNDALAIARNELPNDLYCFMAFIPGNVPSSKNSKRFIPAKGTRGPMLISNATTLRYKKCTGIVYQSERARFRAATAHLQAPFKIEFEFHRDSMRRFDLINATQIVQDMMVEYEYMEDDDSGHVIPMYKQPRVLKNHPGVWIRVIDTSKYRLSWTKIQAKKQDQEKDSNLEATKQDMMDKHDGEMAFALEELKESQEQTDTQDDGTGQKDA